MKTTELSFEIYSKEKYDEIFEEIRKLSPALSPEEISTEIQSRINSTMILCWTWEKEKLESLELFRVRVPRIGETFQESKISSYSYPPEASMIKSKGRANVEGQQVFYAALDGNTAFHEMSQDITPESKVVYLTKWGIKHAEKPVIMRSLFLDIPTDEDTLSSLMAKDLENIINNALEGVPENKRQDYIYGQKKYADLFTWKDKEYYHLTSAIAYYTFVTASKQRAHFSILAYPSVVKNKKTVNFAIRKEFADSSVYLKEVYKVSVNELNDDKVNVLIGGKGVVENGKIKWYKKGKEITINGLYVSFNDDPYKGRTLLETERFTLGSKKDILTRGQILNKVGLTLEKLLDKVKEIPLTLDFEGAQEHETGFVIPVDFNLYLTSDISEKGKIKNLLLSIKISHPYIARDA